MKWLSKECKKGDIIRSKHGAVYHYGIYVSDSEVIQFGKSPLLRGADEKDVDITVIATDISVFSCNRPVERGVFGFGDKFKRFKPDVIVERARRRLGQKGYSFLHNNCEHFAYECATGVKYSSQEELVRGKWKNRPVLDVYFSPIPADLAIQKTGVFERDKEIEGCSSQKVKAEKYWDWFVLSVAAEYSLSMDVKDSLFKKSSNGKWSATDFYFSLSHSENLVCVAVSNSPVGVDVESKTVFPEKFAKDRKIELLSQKIVCRGESFPADSDEFIKLWTKKESIFKYKGKGSFKPAKIRCDKYPVATYDAGEFVFSVCGQNVQKTKAYYYDGTNVTLIKGGKKI